MTDQQFIDEMWILLTEEGPEPTRARSGHVLDIAMIRERKADVELLPKITEIINVNNPIAVDENRNAINTLLTRVHELEKTIAEMSDHSGATP